MMIESADVKAERIGPSERVARRDRKCRDGRKGRDERRDESRELYEVGMIVESMEWNGNDG
jgi:hypothetical protein